MFSQDNKDHAFSAHEQLKNITNVLRTLSPRVHFYCSNKTTDPSQQQIIQVMLNFYANKIMQLENQLNGLKNEVEKIADSNLIKQWHGLSKSIAVNKKYIMQHLVTVKPIESTLQIEHTVKPTRNMTPESSPLQNNHSLFKKRTGALAATTAATLTLGYFYLKHN